MLYLHYAEFATYLRIEQLEVRVANLKNEKEELIKTSPDNKVNLDMIDDLDDILKFNPNTGTWSLVGQMMSDRHEHAVSIISTEEINDYC